MELVKIFIVEYILGYLFQSCVFLLGIYAFNKQRVHLKKYIICVLIYTTVVFVARSLPISFGIHTLLGILALVLMGVKYLKMSLFPVIVSVFFSVVLLFVLEIIDIMLLSAILGKTGFQSMANKQIYRALSALPSSLAFAGIMFCIYYFFTKHSSKMNNDIVTFSSNSSNGNT